MTLTFTDYFIIAFVGIALGVDMLLARHGGQPETISYRVALWSRRWPLIPFMVGMLAGHLFWPNVGYLNP